MSEKNQRQKDKKELARIVNAEPSLKKMFKTESNQQNYTPQPKEEIVKNLEAIANSKCLQQPDHVEASLWNAIEILEDLIDEEERADQKAKDSPQIRAKENEEQDEPSHRVTITAQVKDCADYKIIQANLADFPEVIDVDPIHQTQEAGD